MLISRLQTLNIEWRAAAVQPGTLLWAQAPGHDSRKCACQHILLPRFWNQQSLAFPATDPSCYSCRNGGPSVG